MERTPEFNNKEREVAQRFFPVFGIIVVAAAGIAELSSFSQFGSIAMTGGAGFSTLAIYPMMLKAKIKEFPRWYWRLNYMFLSLFWGFWFLVSVISSLRS